MSSSNRTKQVVLTIGTNRERDKTHPTKHI